MTTNSPTDNDNINARLVQLRLEHRDLDDVIDRLSSDASPNLLQIQRLKKRKLVIKDLIARLESGEIPDIIA
ncbi:YdcH family protein [Pseudomonadota bacterium]